MHPKLGEGYHLRSADGGFREFMKELGIRPSKDAFKFRNTHCETANPNPEVRKDAETAPDWPFREQARYLYDRAVLFRERLIDPIARIDRDKMPDPVISFDNLRNKKTLAAYRLIRNPQGLNYEIILNTQHYEDRGDKKVWRFGEWALNETLAHELVHEWQQTVGEDPVVPGKIYHNKEFVEKCESIGLHPKLGEGYHLQVADGPFEILMDELGIEPPKEVEKLPDELENDWFKKLLDEMGKGRKGRSTLSKWCCPECGLNVRMGIKGNPELRHHPCEEKANKRVFLIRGDVYDAKKELPPVEVSDEQAELENALEDYYEALYDGEIPGFKGLDDSTENPFEGYYG